MWKWTSTDLEVLVHFHIVERGSLESLENIPNFSKLFTGLKRPLGTKGVFDPIIEPYDSVKYVDIIRAITFWALFSID